MNRHEKGVLRAEERVAEVFAHEATAKSHQQADADCGRPWTCQCFACRWLRALLEANRQ